MLKVNLDGKNYILISDENFRDMAIDVSDLGHILSAWDNDDILDQKLLPELKRIVQGIWDRLDLDSEEIVNLRVMSIKYPWSENIVCYESF